MPSPTTPAIPARADSSTLAKHFLPGEPAVIVKLVGVGNTAPFEFRDSKGSRTFVMRWDARAGGHLIRVPLSIWQANNAKIAHDFMDQRRMSHAVVVTVEVPDVAKLAEALPQPASTTSEAQFTLDCIKATIQSYAGQEVTEALLQECLDRITNAVRGTISKSQCGQEVSRLAHTQEIAGSNPATATISPSGLDSIEKIEAEQARVTAQIEHLETFPTEKGATDTDGDALNVVGPGLAEPTVAPASDSEIQPLHESAFDLVEQPKRIKALAALMGVDEAILREAITSPASKVELVNPGWVRRKED